jgi:hypothetical protein
MGDVELGNGNADQVPSAAADHLAVGHVLPQILANLASHDLLESRQVVFDSHGHSLTLSHRFMGAMLTLA